ncbi:MAG TPA: hypothetical protein VKB36_04785 [Vicinamibacterales bacterium]|nr:hypothetical protein [Vicinamibacterales bacterium]
MTLPLRERPAGLLTRHFFHALFDFGVFTQAGADSFVRLLIGLFSMLFAFGFLLVRMYAGKYAGLSTAPTGEPYAHALLADTAVVIALPMWIVALVTVLISQSLFPDETDFRVLMLLPIGRPMIFATKLAAVTLFAGLFTVTSHIAVTPLVLLMSVNRWRMDAPPLTWIAFWLSGVSASAFAVLAVAAVNGLVTLCTPRAWVRTAIGATRSAMIGALVLALPFVMSLPAQSRPLADHARVLYFAPPVWFLGIDRVLLGDADAYFSRLAMLGSIALVAVAVVAAAGCIVLYRRFDRVMLRSLGVSRHHERWRRGVARAEPARAAVQEFTTATFRRSTLHQGVIVGLSACGVALALNTVLRGELLHWLQGLDVPRQEILLSVAGIPFGLIFVLGIAARTAIALPVEPKANWVFRMTERDGIRCDELRAAERIVVQLAALAPVALTLPLQWLVVGPRALVASALTAGFGLLWTEVLLHDWRRIPFTCSYIPGKHTVAQAFIAALGIFLTFGTIIGAIEYGTLAAKKPTAGVVVVAGLLVAVVLLRRRRRALWGETPLLFDDELPDDIQILGLHR